MNQPMTGTVPGDRATLDREQLLENYAELIVAHGLNVQQGQDVQITAEAIHRDLVVRIADRAYARGARFVEASLTDARLGRVRLERSRDEDLDFVPRHVTEKYRDLVDGQAANLRLIGSEDPDVIADQDPARVNRGRLAQHRALEYFYEEGIGKGRVHWTVASAATPAWGKKVFPELEPEAAEQALWQQIFSICRVDRPDFLALWERHNERLHERSRLLNELDVETLHFNGPGTDLRVGLSPRYRFLGGSDQGPRGVPFEPNLPTEEVFTTPDARLTEGRVRATRPFLINGRLIEGLTMTFREGRLTEFTAEAGTETFSTYIESDPGARFLGEVALVDIASPVYQSGHIFQEILFDENAACHIAIGMAYKTALRDGDTLAKAELEAIGCNHSSVHTDMMISDEQVDVTAVTRGGETLPVIEKGAWVLG